MKFHQIKSEVSDTLDQLPEALIYLILDYTESASFHWEALLNDASPDSKLLKFCNEKFLETYIKNFLKVLRHLEEKPSEAISLDFFDWHGLIQIKKNFKNGPLALEYFILAGTPIHYRFSSRRPKEKDIYDLEQLMRPREKDIYDLELLMLFHNLKNSYAMHLYRQLVLKPPSTREFTLNKKDLSIMAVYLELKEAFNTHPISGNIESNLFHKAFNSEISKFLYFESTENSITFTASHLNRKAMKEMHRFSQYKQQYLLLEEKFNPDRIKIEFDKVLRLPTVLNHIICQYLPTNISASAQNLLTQLEGLENKYRNAFDSFCKKNASYSKGLQIFKDALKAVINQRLLYVNIFDFDKKHEGLAQDPINVISKLIEGVGKIPKYDMVFNLLDFFKNFTPLFYRHRGDDVEKFIIDLLEFTETHQCIGVSRQVLNRVIRKKMKDSTFLEEGNLYGETKDELKKINSRLFEYNEHPSSSLIKNPVSFMTLDESGQVRLYLKKQAVIAIRQLITLASFTSIHLSSSFVQQLLSQFPSANIGADWGVDCEKKECGKVITDLMALHFQIAPKTIYSISNFGMFGIYGYKVILANSTYRKIRRTCEKSARLFKPLKKPLQHIIEPLEKEIKSFGKNQALVEQFIKNVKSLTKEFADTHNPEKAQELIVVFLKKWTPIFSQLLACDSIIMNPSLRQNVLNTVLEMQFMSEDIPFLIQGLMTGEISLAVEVLPTYKPSVLGIY